MQAETGKEAWADLRRQVTWTDCVPRWGPFGLDLSGKIRCRVTQGPRASNTWTFNHSVRHKARKPHIYPRLESGRITAFKLTRLFLDIRDLPWRQPTIGHGNKYK
jgi:hypothetical protein